VLKSILGLKTHASEFASELKKLRASIEQLQRDREDLMTAPCTKEDAKELVRAWIADQSRDYRQSLLEQLSGLANHAAGTVGKPSGPIPLGLAQHGMSAQLFGRAICTLFGDALYTSLESIIDKMAWAANALPIAGRADAIAKLDARLGGLIEEEQSLAKAVRNAIEEVKHA
jgi:hypothetical protein